MKLSVLTHHEHRLPSSHTEYQAQGAKVAIFDPQLIRLDKLENLRDQAALLGMAILTQNDIGDQHALLIQYHQSLPR